jgi:polyribonucleotide nucleotidyltransferase
LIKYAARLTDILGDEDHRGDMDFKVTGTRDGICGVQMDIKVDGLSMDTMREALEQARKGRLHILDAMYECIPSARPEVKPHAPRMEKIFIDKEFIGAVIGPQGKIIQEIQRETGATIRREGQPGRSEHLQSSKEGPTRQWPGSKESSRQVRGWNQPFTGSQSEISNALRCIC